MNPLGLLDKEEPMAPGCASTSIPHKRHFYFGLLLGLLFIGISVVLEEWAGPFAASRHAHGSVLGLIALADRFYFAWGLWVVYLHCHVLQNDALRSTLGTRWCFPTAGRLLDAPEDSSPR
jgi:hypothetical protein